ncbi:hypothetical protein [Chryseobacterium sp.]|uniref:hypothetical protein n=1 Tax=Chryseobacterium sp. TaxID=1871047 RepID=UPI00289D9232|nr:hypothetical protein [Chryseobacterium sp.]
MKTLFIIFSIFAYTVIYGQKSITLKYEIDYATKEKMYVNNDNSFLVFEQSKITPCNIVTLQNQKYNCFEGSVKNKFDLTITDKYNWGIDDVVNKFEIFYNEKKGISAINGFKAKEYIVLKNNELIFRVYIDTDSKINNTGFLNMILNVPFSEINFPKGLIVGLKNQKNEDVIFFEVKKITEINHIIKYDIENDIKKNNEREQKEKSKFKSPGVMDKPPF